MKRVILKKSPHQCKITREDCKQCKFESLNLNDCRSLKLLESLNIDISEYIEEVTTVYNPEHKYKVGEFAYVFEDNQVKKRQINESESFENHLKNWTVFSTKELAEEFKWRTDFKRMMNEAFKPWLCDWSDNSMKSTIKYNVNKNKLLIDSRLYVTSDNIHSNSLETVETFMIFFENELIRYFKNELRLP